MAVSKRTRFEVLRRDGSTCQYCGATADQAPMTIDHVTPVSLGGTDDPSNLVTACRDCNAGKASINPGGPLVAKVNADAVLWVASMTWARQKAVALFGERQQYAEQFLTAWLEIDKQGHHLDDGWRTSVAGWQENGLPIELLLEALDIAYRNRSIPMQSLFRYMAGVVRNRLTEIHATARAEFAAAAPAITTAPANSCGHCGYCLAEPKWPDGVCEAENSQCRHCGQFGCLYEAGLTDGVHDGIGLERRLGTDRFRFADVGHRVLVSVVDGTAQHHPDRES